MSLWDWLGLGDSKSAADFYTPEGRGYTWGLDANTVARDTGTTWDQAQGDYASQQAAREQQMALAQMLQARASGQAPSLAEMQLQDALARTRAQTMAMAASASPSQGAFATRQAMQANAMASGQAAASAAQARVAEQYAAQQALAQHLAGMRGQDLAARGQSWDAYRSIRQAELGGSMAYQDAMMGWAGSKAGADEASQQRRAGFLGAGMGAAARAFGGG